MAPGNEHVVLLAGATGYIGRHVARTLVRRGFRVIALTRREPGTEALPWLDDCETCIAEVTDHDALQAALRATRADSIISCIASRNGAPDDARRVDYGANRNLLSLAPALGASRFVLLSAICVQKPLLAFQHAKLAFERELMAAGIDYAIVRPTAFFKSISGQVERVRAGKPFLVFGEGTETACTPISERDLATYLVDCIEQPDRHNRVLPIGGPGGPLTPCDQGELLFELAGKPPQFRKVPVRLFDIAEAVLKPLSWVIPPLAAKAEFARIGRYYATESMLVWDSKRQRYDAEATPAFGSDTLRDHYAALLQGNNVADERGAHRLF